MMKESIARESEISSSPTTEASIAILGGENSNAKPDQQPWLGKIPFYVDPYSTGLFVHHENILDLMQNTLLKGHVIRFSPVDYPPNSPKDENGIEISLVKLAQDLRARAREQGVTLVSGGGSRRPICRSLVCNRSLIATRTPDFHKDGRPIKRRKSKGTVRRLSPQDPACPFRLNIYKDDVSFYLKIGSSASAYHCHHSPDPVVDTSTQSSNSKPRPPSKGQKQKRKISHPDQEASDPPPPPPPPEPEMDLTMAEDSDDVCLEESYAYQILNPCFQSLVQLLESTNATAEDIVFIEKELEKLEKKYRNRIAKRSLKAKP